MAGALPHHAQSFCLRHFLLPPPSSELLYLPAAQASWLPCMLLPLPLPALHSLYASLCPIPLTRSDNILITSKLRPIGSSFCGSAEMNLTSIHQDTGLIPGLTQWVKDLVLP